MKGKNDLGDKKACQQMGLIIIYNNIHFRQ